MIVVIDYGMGNLGSIYNMLLKIGADAVITSDLSEIARASKIILPGVGSFDAGMTKLEKMNFIPTLTKKVMEKKTPILGICLGMQLFTHGSEEGSKAGLGWVDATVVRFRFKLGSEQLKVPHMGWNVAAPRKDSDLFQNIVEEQRFYFLHSYHVVCENQDDVLTTTNYGYEIVSSFQKEGIIGVQFHPEKSHRYGYKFLKHFIEDFVA